MKKEKNIINIEVWDDGEIDAADSTFTLTWSPITDKPAPQSTPQMPEPGPEEPETPSQ